MLVETLDEKNFSHVVVARTFSKYDLSPQNRAFVSRLYFGVLERLIFIDSILNRFSETPASKMKPLILHILRMGIYQILFMNSVPDHAAVNESLKLAQRHGFSGLKPFINGVLRSVSRENVIEPDHLSSQMPDNVRLSVPKWIYLRLCSSFGKDRAEAFLKGSLNARKKVTFHPNTSLMPEEDILRALKAEGCGVTEYAKDCYCLTGFGSLTELKSWNDGLIFVQHPGSVRAAAMACEALRSISDEPLIIDVCAAPGGKSVYIAERLPKAKVISRDISDEKTALIRENIKRLRLSNIDVQIFDALQTDEGLICSADLVICDVPCSGLGMIGEKPDIKARLREKDIPALASLSRRIAAASCRYVKNGGLLLYSTCTLTEEENTDNSRFICGLADFEILDEFTSLPDDGTDGFYACLLKKQ